MIIKIQRLINLKKENLLIFFKDFCILAMIILLVDAFFLKMISRSFGKMIKEIQGSEMKLRWNYAMVAYLLIIIQIYFLLVKSNRPLNNAFLLGATTYGIFDFTSMAILKNYKLNIALMDMFWGGTLYYIVLMLFRKIKPLI